MAPATDPPPATLLEVEDLHVHFPARRVGHGGEVVRAVDGVSVSVQAGETVAVVGESGCGKSTLAKTILRVHQPTSGGVRYLGEDVFQARGVELQRIRRDIQLVFQDATSAMDPRMRVREIVDEPLRTHHRNLGKAGRRARVDELLRLVSLDPSMSRRHPHEFSGGQRQRIAIARALAADPRLIVLDESVAALDVSIQAQIVNLLQDLKDELGVAYLFISHDLSVVHHLADRVVVMYLGHLVESGPVDEVLDDPQHPYTRGLIEAIPVPDPSLEAGRRGAHVIGGELSANDAERPGCQFAPRCPLASEECTVSRPPLKTVGVAHEAACFKAPGPAVASVGAPVEEKG